MWLSEEKDQDLFANVFRTLNKRRSVFHIYLPFYNVLQSNIYILH